MDIWAQGIEERGDRKGGAPHLLLNGRLQMRVAFALLSFILGSASVSNAAPGPGCVPGSNIVSAERATQFLDDPAALLGQFKDGQGGLASEVRDLVTVRPETIEGMVSLAKAGSVDQNRAIGAGLGTAATVCVLSQPATAQQIQETVLKTQNPDLIQAFVGITGDIPTEAVVGADPNGDTTAGGGRGTTSTGRPGAVSPSGTIVFSGGAGAGGSGSVFSAASVGGTGLLVSVSPSH